MAVPKSGGCCGGSTNSAPKKPAAKKPATKSSATKKSTTSKTSSTSTNRNNDEALKKRLKKVLGKDNDTKGTSTKGNSDEKENNFPTNSKFLNEIQKFILNAAQPEKKATPFTKIDKNAKKTTTTTKASTSSTVKASKPEVKKPAATTKPATTRTTQNTTAANKKTTAKTSASSTSGSCCKPAAAAKKPASTTSAKKTSSAASTKKTTSTTKKKATTTTTATANKKGSSSATKKALPAKKPLPVKKATTTKKTTTSRMSCGGGGCGYGPRKTQKSSGCGGGCGCDTSSSYDSSDEYSDDETGSYSDYTPSYTSETDSDSEGGCAGGACGRPQKPANKGPNKNNKKDQDGDSSGSWETDSSDDDYTNYSKKTCSKWQCESISSPMDTFNNYKDTSWTSEEIFDCNNNSENEGKPKKRAETVKKERNRLKRTLEYNKGEGDDSKKLNGFASSSDSSSEDTPLSKKAKTSEAQNRSNKSSNSNKNVAIKTENNLEPFVRSPSENSKNENKKDKIGEKSRINANVKSSPSSDSGYPANIENNLNQSLVPYKHSDNSMSDYSFDEYENRESMLADFNEDGSGSSSVVDNTYDEEEDESCDDEYDSYSSDIDDWYDEEISEEGSEYSDYEYAGDFEEEETDNGSIGSSESSESVYESSKDDDYELPEGIEEDIIIKRGEAKIYEATDDIHFDSDDSSPQIFELSNEENSVIQSTLKYSSEANVVNIERSDDNCSDKSSDSCPQLIPIDPKIALKTSEESSQYSNSDDSYSSDSSDELVGFDTPVYEPEIINAAKGQIEDAQFIDSFLESSYQENSPISFSNPLTCIMQKSSNLVNKGFVSSIKTKNDKKKRNSIATSDVGDMVTTTSSLTQPSSKFYNSMNQRQVLLLLKSPIYFHGALKVKLLAGNLNVLGYDFTIGETQETFSPRGNNLLSLVPSKVDMLNKTITSKDDIIKNLSTLAKDFMRSEIDEIAKEFDPAYNALILLERNNNSKRINMVQKYMKENIFPNSITDRGNNCYKSELFTRCRFFTEAFNSLNINPEWNSINLVNSSKLIVVGGKGVGKSTFLRYTINKNLRKFKKFLLIDLDIGQPETFAPQTISATIISKPIIGPGYFYGLKPAKSYLYGDINVVLSPITYLTNVKELFKYCHGEKLFQNIPWIVNTMGYNKGFGAELISVIIEYLQPTDVVQLISSKQYNNFDFLMSSKLVRSIPRNIYVDEPRLDIFDYKLFELNSVVQSQKSDRYSEWVMSAKDTRLTMIIAILGDLLSERDQWLTDVVPYSVPVEEVNLISIDEDNLNKADLLDVVNANIVYLCKDSKPAIECYGIGIVRGVDKIRQILYLLPSVPATTLAHVNTIAICNIPLPASILLNQGPKIRGMVPYTYNTNDLISSKHVPQNIYRPQHYLQGARNIILDE